MTITSISRVYNYLGDTVAKQLPSIHALSGCDATSSMFGLSKATSYEKITRRGELASQINVFGNLEASHSQITEAGMPVLAMLYGGNLTDSFLPSKICPVPESPGHQLSSFAPGTFAAYSQCCILPP